MLIRLSELIQAFLNEKPVQLLTPEQIEAQALAALRFYMGWGQLEDEYRGDLELLPKPQTCSMETCLSSSDWALIKPLFVFYVERETAIQLEASRGMGIDVFGRSTSEIMGDIRLYEESLPRLAFSQPLLSIGIPQ